MATDRAFESATKLFEVFALRHRTLNVLIRNLRANVDQDKILDLSGVPAIVTGGGSGLGAATARALSRKGAKVTVFDISRDNVERVAAEIQGISPLADVSSEEQVRSALDKGEAAHGVARVLVNCAGIGGGGKRTLGKDGPHPLDQFTRVINVNLIGTFNVIRLAAQGSQPNRRKLRNVASSSIRPVLPPTMDRSTKPLMLPQRRASPE